MDKEKYDVEDLLKIIDEMSWSFDERRINLDDFDISNSELVDALNKAKTIKNIRYRLKAFSDGHGELVLYRKNDNHVVREFIAFVIMLISLLFCSIIEAFLWLLVYPLWSLGNLILEGRWMTYLEFIDEWNRWMRQ